MTFSFVSPQTTVSVMKYGFAVAGAGMLGAAVYFGFSTYSFVSSSAQTTGVIVALEGSRSKRSVAEFMVNGRTFRITSEVASSPPAHRIGDSVGILYPADNPDKARLNSLLDMWFLPLFFCLMGSVFFAVGGGMIFFSLRRERITQYLKTNGRRLETKFSSVDRNESLKVNGTSPYRITSQYTDEKGALHVFQSDDLWFDPTNHVGSGSITVLVDPNNFRRYWMDTSFLPKLA
jgi:hypothetical protein